MRVGREHQVLGVALIVAGFALAGPQLLAWRQARPPAAFGPALPGPLTTDTAGPATTAAGDDGVDRVHLRPPSEPAPTSTSGPAVQGPATPATPAARLEVVGRPRPAPARVRLAAVDLDAAVVGAAVHAGELAIPDDPSTAGWYAAGPSPGEEGSAVLAAHVDFAGRLGAFFHLEDAAAGDEVEVDLDDGSVQRFRVVSLGRFPRGELPVDELFTPKGPPVLTLITCGGDFDAATHHYTQNVVVRAVPEPPPA